jgi:hypothetical protein
MIFYMVLCVFLSCSKSEDAFELKGEPDKVLENITGTLHYSLEDKIWFIHYAYPETIDSADEYLIKEMPNGDFPLEEGAKVRVSGLCYLTNPEYPVLGGALGGHTYYYIFITELKYE